MTIWQRYRWDSGSTRSGKLSPRYQLTDTFAMRGTASNGFRAPSLAQENYKSVVTLQQNGALEQVGTFRTSSPTGHRAGRPAADAGKVHQ